MRKLCSRSSLSCFHVSKQVDTSKKVISMMKLRSFSFQYTFECFLRRNAFLSAFGRERQFKLVYWWSLFFMELSSEWRDAWSNSYIKYEKTMFPLISSCCWMFPIKRCVSVMKLHPVFHGIKLRMKISFSPISL